MAYLRSLPSRVTLSAFLSSLLFCTGCIHRTSTPGATYTLEKNSGYSLLVPSLSSQSGDQDFQTSLLTLSKSGRAGNSGPDQRCAIHGSVFSLSPDSTGRQNQWAIKSLSAQGWQNRAGSLDIHAEWNRFLDGLLELERQSCFPRKETFYNLRRAIAERIPIPANEAAFFAYSFSGSGFVDLAPGMQIKVERPLVQNATPASHASYKGSLEADYRVISLSGTAVELHLFHTANRRAGRSLGAAGNLPFELSSRFAPNPLLRLFLQSIGDGTTQPAAILLGANSIHDLEEATRQIEEKGRTTCPTKSSAPVECVFFGTGTAVSLLSSFQINGRTELHPFGTTMGYLVDVASSKAGHSNADAQTRMLQTASLNRPLVGGSYAEISFPRTMEAVSQIVLLPGDRIAWNH